MIGLEISNVSSTLWVPASAVCAALTVALGIWVGPMGIYFASILGVIFASVALVRNWRKSSRVTGNGAAGAMLGLHIVFLGVGFTLDALFLRPLSNDSLQMPRLSQQYADPDAFFEVRAPAGWSAESLRAPTEAGVRFRPMERGQYMGVSELTVRVRELGIPEISQPGFLKRMAETISASRRKGAKLFEFSTAPARLLSGGEGLWSRLVVKRFWVPLYQLSLFGIQDRHYLCSVSVTGLRSHATLSAVVCLGVFETIRVKHVRVEPTKK